jgi:hypothetical protein
VLFLAPIAGGIGGYWIGLNRNFKRPAPEWSK